MTLHLPKNPLPSLADEILAALAGLMIEFPCGPSAHDIASHVGADLGSVRAAMRRLNADARADLMRRPDSREQFLVPFRFRKAIGLRFCSHCNATFSLPPAKKAGDIVYYSNRRTCSRACAIAWSWTRPGARERRIAGIKLDRQRPEAKARLAAHNRRRWSKPGEREKLAEQNRLAWADPVKGALRAQSIKAINGSPEMREFYSNLRKEWWKDPLMREKMINAMQAAHSTPEARAKASARMEARWRDPVWRKKWLRAVRKNAQKARAVNLGRKQSQEQIRKRVESTQKTRAERRHDAEASA